MLEKAQILSPCSQDEQFVGIFVRKRKTKSGKPRYYLYDKPNEDLILCADEETPTKYVISQSSTDISESNEFFVGNLIGNKKDCQWIGYDCTDTEVSPPREQIRITYAKASDKKQETFRQVSVVVHPEIKLPQKLPIKIGNKYLMRSPAGIDGIPSQKNMIIESPEGSSAIVFQKCTDQEFYLAVKKPCSIFQGFCMALSTLKKFGKE